MPKPPKPDNWDGADLRCRGDVAAMVAAKLHDVGHLSAGSSSHELLGSRVVTKQMQSHEDPAVEDKWKTMAMM